jgi:hypothetical protein
MRKGLIIFGLLCCLISIAGSKGVIVQPWQNETIQLPVTSMTDIEVVNPTQLRLLTKYYAVEQAYMDLASFVLALPVDSSRTVQTVVDKRPQLAVGLDALIRNKSVLSDFEYTSDSSAQLYIALDSKLVTKLFQPYWKPEPVPKPKKVIIAKEDKPADKPEEVKPELTKPAEPAKPEPKVVAPVVPVPPAPKPIEPAKREMKPVIPYTPAPRTAVPVNPNANPIPNVKKEDQPPKQDSTSPEPVK